MDSDGDLVRRLQRGEMGALKEAYEQHGARVHRLCLRLLGRSCDAEDATQDVFIKLFERAGSFDRRARFTTWLHQLTVNLCLHRLEKERLRASRPLPEGDSAPEDLRETPVERLGRAEERGLLQALLLRLPPEQRAVLVLREIEELSYQEIAETLAIPIGTVMSRLSRARELLVRLARPASSTTVAP